MTADALVVRAAEVLAEALGNARPAYVSYAVDASLLAPHYRRTALKYTSIVVVRTADGASKVSVEDKQRDEITPFPLAPDFNGLSDFQIEVLIGFPHYIALRPQHIILVGRAAKRVREPGEHTPDVVVTYLKRYLAEFVGAADAPNIHVHLTALSDDGGRHQMRISDVYVDRQTSLPTAVEYVGSLSRRLRVSYVGSARSAHVEYVTYHVNSPSLGTVDFESHYRDLTTAQSFELPPT